MSEGKKNIFSKVSDKLKKIKHLDIILTVLFIAIVLLIYFSTLQTSPSTKESQTKQNTGQSVDSEFSSYASGLRSDLEKAISSIDGAGSSTVILYFGEGIKTEIAYTIETKTSSDGSITETKSPVLIANNGSQDPIILQKIMPKPISVVIVAQGAQNTKVKLEILRLVEAMLGINSQKIEIFAGN